MFNTMPVTREKRPSRSPIKTRSRVACVDDNVHVPQVTNLTLETVPENCPLNEIPPWYHGLFVWMLTTAVLIYVSGIANEFMSVPETTPSTPPIINYFTLPGLLRRIFKS